MRIRFTQTLSGSQYVYNAGDVADWANADEAVRLLSAGIAEAVPEEKVVETTAQLPAADMAGAAASETEPSVVKPAVAPKPAASAKPVIQKPKAK